MARQDSAGGSVVSQIADGFRKMMTPWSKPKPAVPSAKADTSGHDKMVDEANESFRKRAAAEKAAANEPKKISAQKPTAGAKKAAAKSTKKVTRKRVYTK